MAQDILLVLLLSVFSSATDTNLATNTNILLILLLALSNNNNFSQYPPNTCGCNNCGNRLF